MTTNCGGRSTPACAGIDKASIISPAKAGNANRAVKISPPTEE
jgi:hypothetical protein